MLFNGFRPILNEIFDMEYVNVGQRIKSDEPERLISYWGALISNKKPLEPANSLLVTVVRTDQWHKGLILIPPFDEARKLTRPVDMDSWQDPMVACLRQFNAVAEEDYHDVIFKLEFVTGPIFGGYETRQKSPASIVEALFKAINDIEAHYGDKFVENYFSDTTF